MEIDFKNYLSDEEIKEIVKEKIGNAITAQLSKESDLKRIITNSSYDIVYKMVDKQYGMKLESMMSDKVKKIVSELTAFNVFKKPDAWDRESNSAYDYLQKCIKDRFPEIKRTVSEQIEPQTIAMLKGDLKEYIYESISGLFKESE